MSWIKAEFVDLSQIHGPAVFGNMFSKTAFPTETVPSETGVGKANSPELISFFLGILPTIQDAAIRFLGVPCAWGPSQHSKLRQK